MVYRQHGTFSHFNRPQKLADGFTLVEILTVIGIISVIAAILTPVFLNAREKSRQSVCASNLSQLYKAVAMYAQDNDGFRPMYVVGAEGILVSGKEVDLPDQSAELAQCLMPYVRSMNLWFCPDDPLRSEKYGTTGVPKRHPTTSYRYDEAIRVLPSGQITPGQLLPTNRSAAELFLFMDDIMPYMAETPPDTYLYIHEGRFNVVFCDGHVRTMSPHDDDCQGYCH